MPSPKKENRYSGGDEMSFDGIFRANSVAVIGASKDVTKRGYQAIRTLLDERYEGTIYPVNPREKRILGLKCYASVMDIPENFDLALITTPANTLKKILDECGQKGVSGAVVIAGGFGELGEEGRRLEKEIVDAARKNDIRIIGPNTSGMISMNNSLNLVGLKNVPKGNIALLTQSGNIALTLITEAGLKSRMGFNYYVGVGNEADIKFHEYLDYFTEDPETKVILMYVEGLREGRRFLQQASRTSQVKPIVLFKSGRSAKGSKSAGSHTGALAGISEVSRTAFERAGIIGVDHSDEMFPIAESLASLPLIYDNSIAILADGGGHATIAADYLTELGILLPELDEKTRKRLGEILPSNASLANPVDVAGGPTRTLRSSLTARKFCWKTVIFMDCLSSVFSGDMAFGLRKSWLLWKRMRPTGWVSWYEKAGSRLFCTASIISPGPIPSTFFAITIFPCMTHSRLPASVSMRCPGTGLTSGNIERKAPSSSTGGRRQ